MATKEQRHAEVTAMVEKWKPRLYLHEYRISVEIRDAPHDEDEQCSAEIRADLADQYHHARIDVYPRFFESPSDVRDREILHELVHIPLNVVAMLVKRQHEGNMVTPMEKRAAVERVTDWLADAIYAAYDAPKPEIVHTRKRRK